MSKYAYSPTLAGLKLSKKKFLSKKAQHREYKEDLFFAKRHTRTLSYYLEKSSRHKR